MSIENAFVYYEITSQDTDTDKPQTSTGVSLGRSDDSQQIYLAYVGKGHQHIWWMSSDDPLIRGGNGVPIWHNAQVKIEGQHPLVSQIRPAIVAFKGQPTIVSITLDQQGIMVSSFDGAQWIASTTALPRPADAVCAVVLSDILYVFFTASGGIWQLTVSDLPPAASGPPELKFLPGDKGAPPTWAWSIEACRNPDDASKVFLFSVPWHSGNASYMYFDPTPPDWNLPVPQAIEPDVDNQNPLFTRFATVAVLGSGYSTFLFLGQGTGSALMSADSQDDFTAAPPPTLKLGDSNRIYGAPPVGELDAQHQPALLVVSNPYQQIYFAHQGAHSGNIWFGVAEGS